MRVNQEVETEQENRKCDENTCYDRLVGKGFVKTDDLKAEKNKEERVRDRFINLLLDRDEKLRENKNLATKNCSKIISARPAKHHNSSFKEN